MNHLACANIPRPQEFNSAEHTRYGDLCGIGNCLWASRACQHSKATKAHRKYFHATQGSTISIRHPVPAYVDQLPCANVPRPQEFNSPEHTRYGDLCGIGNCLWASRACQHSAATKAHRKYFYATQGSAISIRRRVPASVNHLACANVPRPQECNSTEHTRYGDLCGIEIFSVCFWCSGPVRSLPRMIEKPACNPTAANNPTSSSSKASTSHQCG